MILLGYIQLIYVKLYILTLKIILLFGAEKLYVQLISTTGCVHSRARPVTSKTV